MFINKYFILISILAFLHCKEEEKKQDLYEWKTIEVIATAYNSLAYQTNSNPSIGAFGDSLVPGMRCIAVSRDLLKMGIKHNTPVKIEGLDSIYLVKDKNECALEKTYRCIHGHRCKSSKELGQEKGDYKLSYS